MNKRVFIMSILIIATLLLSFVPVAYADETNEDNEQTVENAEVEEQEETKQEEQKEEKPTVTSELKADEPTIQDDATTTGTAIEEHKVAVITTKVDENNNPLEGAVLQILDSEGNVVDEWTSTKEAHTSLLFEGNYTLHEVSAPEGYVLAEDKAFTIKIEIADINAGMDSSDGPCTHYGPFLYYVEIKGEKYEVYCINQDWETPDDNSIYDGAVLNPADINDLTTQTVYVDAEKNKEKKDISDQSLTSQELYDKLLDIVYHRQLASDLFSDLTEAEIRYVTESALKNYTNAGLTRVQRVSVSQAPTGYESTDYYITDDGGYMWYLYPWYRSFIYNPDAPLGQDIFITSIGNGDAFGTLVKHWCEKHNAKNDPEVRAKIARFYELWLYLIGDADPHPSDLYLYIYSSDSLSPKTSVNDFDGGVYQNLLGISWYNPYDEDNVVNLKLVNKKETKKEKKKEKKEHNNPQTGDSVMTYFIILTASLGSIIGSTIYTTRKEY